MTHVNGSNVFRPAVRNMGLSLVDKTPLIRCYLKSQKQELQFLSTCLYICRAYGHMTYDYNCPISLHRYACNQRDQSCEKGLF